jgi:hypothetical protein
MNQKAIDTLRQFCESPENLEILQKLTDNLNAIADQQPLPYPEMLKKDINEPETKRLKLEPETTPEVSSAVKNINEETFFQEIKNAVTAEVLGNIENQHLNNIKEILNQKPNFINKKSTDLMIVPLNIAVCSGSLNLTKELLKFDPNLYSINSFGETTLNQAMRIVRNQKSSSIFNSCVEILKAHQKAGTIDNSVFNHQINDNENCYQLMANILKEDLSLFI